MSERRAVPASSPGATWQRWRLASFEEQDAAAHVPEVLPDPGPDPRQVREEARRAGHAQGLAEGRSEGYDLGVAEGRARGYEQGLEEGRKAGHAAGLIDAREQGAEEATRLRAIAEATASSLAQLEEKTGQALLTLALDIARQVVRVTVAQQPEALLAAVREVLHMNPTAGAPLRLWLHPLDLELVRLHLAEELKTGPWRVLADESITRGGCRAETSLGEIDATLETRWRRVAASLGRDMPLEDAQ
ncbi:flagellar assembly protein FliH [Bordetella bronchialis]|uniref:Flagellar assembly protein FliH n=1 Tax=Bordetella bronchialis TaxID=463025 RepID=A0A193FGD7_9BORD|nr:flagellar assembly protein FliH [Bordetella bronchialis]ANN66827.1 flagellar assembly protein FliH [Bordetella bronchialis]ANN71903.1 flagellar assembly protein FliH [Bordetella bronchialis]